ncbi:unnamed protein product [Peniophora sp. CBMAI 1063]|nr:unnamed protein product [Peniophora sp. CBMAI 1063]
MSHTSMASPSAAGSSVDAEYNTVLAARRHNARIPIARLPADALTLIFSFVASFDPLIEPVRAPFRAALSQRHSTILRWITITHICSLWRAVVLEDSRFWSEVPSRLGVSWAKEIMCRRGQRGGLVFEHRQIIPLSPFWQVHFLERSLPFIEDLRMSIEVDRISRLLTGYGSPVYVRAIESPVPQLRVLCLRTNTTSSAKIRWPSRLFAGQAPLLRKVDLKVEPELTPIVLSSLTTFLPCLTSLVIEIRLAYLGEFTPIHAALSLCGSLEHLAFLSRFFECEASEIDDLPSLDLPRMKTCLIEAPLDNIEALVNVIRSPDSCKLALICHLPSFTDALGTFTEALSGHFSNIRSLEIAIRKIPEKHTTIAGWRLSSSQLLTEDFVLHSSGERRRPLPDISLSFRSATDRTFFPNEMPQVFDDLFYHYLRELLFGVENLSFRISNGAQSEGTFHPDLDWVSIRETFQSLQWLRVDRHVAESLLDILDGSMYTEDFLSPDLKHLVLIGVHWHADTMSDAYKLQEGALRRFLQGDEDTSGTLQTLATTRSITVGGDAGGTHEMLPESMPDIPFTVVQAVEEEDWPDYDIINV